MNVKSIARVKYSYNLDGINMTGNTTSNVVSTEVRKMGLLARKFSSSDFYKEGDILTFSIIIQNTGNYPVNNVVLTDYTNGQELLLSTIRYSTLTNNEFLACEYEYLNNNLVIKLNSINPNTTCIINYKSIITTSANSISSTLKISSDEIAETTSLPLDLKQGYAQIECIKKVNEDFTYLNSDLTYELTLKNTGNMSAYNVEVFDELPSTFQLDSQYPIMLDGSSIDYQLNDNVVSFILSKIQENEKITIQINGKIIK